MHILVFDAVCALNDKLYRPLADTDPDIVAFAESIRRHGLLEPIVITRDGFILSGHRRHRACRLAGLRTIPCRVADITSTDPEFLARLCECNRQRVKSLDEVAREQILAANPEEEHRALLEHRRRRAEVEVATIPLVGTMRRARISGAKEPMLQAILSILQSWRRYWPLTERQIHYALGSPTYKGSSSRALHDATIREPACPAALRGGDGHRRHRCCARRPHAFGSARSELGGSRFRRSGE
jgi:hypothetical protein